MVTTKTRIHPKTLAKLQLDPETQSEMQGPKEGCGIVFIGGGCLCGKKRLDDGSAKIETPCGDVYKRWRLVRAFEQLEIAIVVMAYAGKIWDQEID